MRIKVGRPKSITVLLPLVASEVELNVDVSGLFSWHRNL